MRYIYMKLLTTSTDSQTIKVIPREYVTSATFKLTDDSSNVTSTYSVTPTTDRNYLSFSQALTLKEGRFYDMVLAKTDGTIIYKDKVFCTAQSVNQASNDYYTINKDVYTSDTSYDNDYIML